MRAAATLDALTRLRACVRIVIACGGIVACGSARRSEPIAGPLTLGGASLQRGREVYMQECQRCHPGGEAGVGPSLNDKPAPRFLIRLQIRQGLGAMPAFSRAQLDDQVVEDVIDYMMALRRHGT
jgi:mono/diheme cytochrome c family protein